MSTFPEFDRKKIKMLPLKKRVNKVRIEETQVRPDDEPDELPQLALDVIADTAQRLRFAREHERARMLVAEIMSVEGIDHVQMAKVAGVSSSQLYAILSGRSDVQVIHFFRLARQRPALAEQLADATFALLMEGFDIDLTAQGKIKSERDASFLAMIVGHYSQYLPKK